MCVKMVHVDDSVVVIHAGAALIEDRSRHLRYKKMLVLKTDTRPCPHEVQESSLKMSVLMFICINVCFNI